MNYSGIQTLNALRDYLLECFGMVARIDDRYYLPPFHPNCRCTLQSDGVLNVHGCTSHDYRPRVVVELLASVTSEQLEHVLNAEKLLPIGVVIEVRVGSLPWSFGWRERVQIRERGLKPSPWTRLKIAFQVWRVKRALRKSLTELIDRKRRQGDRLRYDDPETFDEVRDTVKRTIGPLVYPTNVRIDGRFDDLTPGNK